MTPFMSFEPGSDASHDHSPGDDALKGQFLVAGRQLRDPNFYQSVVLMVEHGSSGSMGLVVNRPSNVSLARALSEHFEIPDTGDLIYVGGPVEPAALFVLHGAHELDDEDSHVVPGISIGSSPNVFERVIQQVADGKASSESDGLAFRVFAGCAGWAPGQLDGELQRGDWHLLPALAAEILPSNPYVLWEDLVARVHAANRTIPPTPGNPEWN